MHPKQKNSRFPVYEEEIDNILGIVHIRDIMKFYLDPDMRGKKLKEIGDALMPVGFIPETRKISRLFYADESQPDPSLCGDR